MNSGFESEADEFKIGYRDLYTRTLPVELAFISQE